MKTVQEALAELPDSWEKIRDLFREQRVKGRTNDCVRCPLARWLTQQTGERVMVGEEVVSVNDHDFELDEAQKDFVSQFDSGDFPELKEEVEA